MRPTLKDIHDRCAEEGECWIWQQSVTSAGYPQASIGDRSGVHVRRLVADLASLRPPRSRAAVLTSRCGEKRCCSPSCLFWTDKGAVMRASYQSGARSLPSEYFARVRALEKQGRTRLSWAQAEQIRAQLAAGLSASQIAREHGVYETTIRNIRHGRSWRTASPFAVLGA